ncbi:hypothetical protein [Massilia endophytica]|uniref:hypothetical protein n=1 Tax=Massilia endophytica TaxID=2899220 RepID=UPI001E59AD24|nr:hypothetical protein [Massilia endophytica]UGQ45102.1 hypothetical protein LSQ66_15015 [Massilia endophytica]
MSAKGGKAFSLVFQDLRDGRAHAEMTGQLSELLAAVKETGKPGSLTLKIDVKPSGRGSDVDKVSIIDTITAKVPKPDRGSDFFWLTEDNDLSRNHPRQHNLDLRDAGNGQPSSFKEA